MVMLEAALAFAVVMIIFSTVVTGIIEFIHRIMGTRHKHLKRMVGHLFDQYLVPRLGRHLSATNARDREKFIQAMTENPMAEAPEKFVPPATDLSSLGFFEKIIQFYSSLKSFFLFSMSPFRRKVFGKEIEILTPLAFAERLARTDIGLAILEEGEDQLEALIDDFSRSFDRLGRTASEFLQNRARSLSILVGIVLALAVSIDAGKLMTALVENPELRTALIDQSEEAIEENRKASQKLDDLLVDIKAGKAQAVTAKDIVEAQEALKNNVDSLKKQGLPIGFEEYPWVKDAPVEPSGYVRWFFMCVLSGVLIGLGGPFWYRVFTKISQLTTLLKAVGFGARKEVEESKQPPKTAEEKMRPETVSDAFLTAARNHNIAHKARNRAILGADGTPL
ncbi:hypothetical protein [Sneathiella sp.]|jgi:hypothetical protein|uniref:hypothetical protein n=1 Tax=Sneathiella sp. TaxID=1964365 RepID=UPI0039E65D33